MSAELLIRELERVNDEPRALPLLRRFVFDLAIEGRLVEQRDDEESAHDLLARIATVKAQTASRQRRQKLSSVREQPFLLPETWVWTCLADIGFLSPRNDLPDNQLASFVPMPGISAAYGVPIHDEVRRWAEIKKGYTHFMDGDVAVAKITPCFENGKSSVFRGLRGGFGSGTTELHVVRPVLVHPDFILIFLKSTRFVDGGIPVMTGTAGQKRLPSDYFAGAPLPLPPLAEQERIVAKVEELMALCDQLERAQKEREIQRDALRSASLFRLTATADERASDLSKDLEFFIESSQRFITKPEHITSIRQTILHLAVTGQLRNMGADSSHERRPIHSVASLQNGFAFKSEWFQSTGIRLLRNVNVGHGDVEWTSQVCLPESLADEFTRFSLAEGDIVVSLDRPFIKTGTKVAIVRKRDLPCLLLQRVGRFQLDERQIDARYLFLWVQSPLFSLQIDPGRSNGVPHVSSKQIESAQLVLPSLEEQRRIITDVDLLMMVCTELESALGLAKRARVRLLESLLHSALNGARTPRSSRLSQIRSLRFRVHHP
jgi:type I restriction enzyme S subunit